MGFVCGKICKKKKNSGHRKPKILIVALIFLCVYAVSCFDL